MPFSKYAKKPLWWWLQTPLYAYRIAARQIRARFARQCAESDTDRIVYNAFFRRQSPGIMVEVGAARPDFLSVSALFRARGWRVLSVEPNPRFAAMHRARGHEIYEFAAGECDRDDVSFEVVHSDENGEISNESYSSLAVKPEYAALNSNLNIEPIRVNLRRLDTILSQSPEIARINLLCVDCEGYEIEVLNGLDFNKYKPRVLIIENLFDNQNYRDYMSARGYRLWRTIHPNDVYVIES